MGRRTVAVALSVVALVAAGCGSTGASSPTSSTAAVASDPSPTPAANEYVDAIVHTRGLGTAATTVTLTTSVGDQTRDLAAEGGIDLSNGYGELTWQDAQGARFRERSNGKGLFVQSDPPNGTWERYADVSGTATGRVPDTLRGLGSLLNLQAPEAQVVQGVTFHRYTGELPASARALGQLGIAAEDAEAIAVDAGDAVMSVTVWIDPAGRVVRIDRAVDLPETSRGPVRAESTTRLSEFSGDLNLSPPPTESVVDATAS